MKAQDVFPESAKRKLHKFEILTQSAWIASIVVLFIRSIIAPDPKSIANWVMIGFAFVCVVIAIVLLVISMRARRDIEKREKH